VVDQTEIYEKTPYHLHTAIEDRQVLAVDSSTDKTKITTILSITLACFLEAEPYGAVLALTPESVLNSFYLVWYEIGFAALCRFCGPDRFDLGN
jgi:hypothetical protein